MKEQDRQKTKQFEAFTDLMSAIDLYWDNIIPLLVTKFEFLSETASSEGEIQRRVLINKSFNDGNYEIEQTESLIIIPGELPILFPKRYIKFTVTPELLSEGRIAIKRIGVEGETVSDYEVSVGDINKNDPEAFLVLEQIKLDVLSHLVESGMDYDSEDPFIDKIKTLAYKVLGSDAEELWS